MKHAFAIFLTILTTSSALVAEEVNATAPKNTDDTLWLAKQSVLPPLSAAVTITFTKTNPKNLK